IATSAAALPSDPGADTCSGCVVNDTPSSNAYSSATLTAGQTYFWEVKGRPAANDTQHAFGNWSSQFMFTTSGPTLPGPTISGIEPLPILASDQIQTLIVSGTNFALGANIILRATTANLTYEHRIPTSLSSSQFAINVVLGASPQHWTIQIVNPPDQPSQEFGFDTVAPDRPDLLIDSSSIIFSPTMLSPGASVSITATVLNHGNKTSPATTLTASLSANSAASPLSVGLAGAPVSGISAGGSQVISFQSAIPQGTPPGQFQLKLNVDPNNSVDDSDTTNNDATATQQLTVMASQAQAPTIDQFCCATDLQPGGTQTLEVSAHGEGTLGYRWFRNGQPISFLDERTTTLAVIESGMFSVEVTNGAGTTTSSVLSVTCSSCTSAATTLPAPGELSQETLSPDVPTVLIVHGFIPSGPCEAQPWQTQMAKDVSAQLSQKQIAANTAYFFWPDACEPLFNYGIASGKTASNADYLAKQLRTQLGAGYSKGLHLIGHSLGAVVIAEVVHDLPDFQNIQVTLLDPPISDKCTPYLGWFDAPGYDQTDFDRLLYNAPIVRWVDSYYGTNCQSSFPAFGDPIDGANNFVVTGADHNQVHSCYDQSVLHAQNSTNADCPLSIPLPFKGFDESVVYGVEPDDLSPWTQSQVISTPGPALIGSLLLGGQWSGSSCQVVDDVLNVSAPVLRLQGDSSCGTGSTAMRALQRTTSGTGVASSGATGAVATAELAIPSSAKTLAFRLKVTGASAQDYLSIDFNGQPIFTYAAQSFGSSKYVPMAVSLGALSGQIGTLTFALHVSGVSSTQVSLADLIFQDGSTLGGPVLPPPTSTGSSSGGGTGGTSGSGGGGTATTDELISILLAIVARRGIIYLRRKATGHHDR
ncbi:MAG: CARDB domain-containing protein, partial [Nevskia sp.]|nr:CARDB domain-containing protein [Nevskia sp.]